MAKIRKGDKVVVLAGKDKGKEGIVSRVFPDKDRVIVDGVNVVKKHQKAQGQTRQAGIIDREMPLHVSNVAPIAGGKPTRVGFRVDDKGNKIRVSKRTGSDL